MNAEVSAVVFSEWIKCCHLLYWKLFIDAEYIIKLDSAGQQYIDGLCREIASKAVL